MISVVVATWNRGALLKDALGSLVEQSLDPHQYEIVVVDDGSDDHTPEVVDMFRLGGKRLNYYRQPHSGLAAAKNTGMGLCCHDLVLFFDDDDLAHRDLLVQHVATHAAYPRMNHAVLGFTDWAAHLDRTPLMKYLTEVGHFLFDYDSISHGDLLHYWHFWGGRTSVKHRFLEEYGQFNPVFAFGCEDIELGYRLHSHGLRVVYNANAMSWINRPMNLREACRRHENMSRSRYKFYQLHPVEPIRNWVNPEKCEQHWEHRRPLYESKLACAREAEAILGGAPLEKQEALLGELHEYYEWLLNAASYKGLTAALVSAAQ